MIENTAIQPAPKYQDLRVSIQIVMPLGRYEQLDPSRLTGSQMANGNPGHMAARIVGACAKAGQKGEKGELCINAELLDNAYGRELLAYVQAGGPRDKRDHCVAHLTGQRPVEQQDIFVAEAFSCGPHGCGFVCDVSVVSDYR